MDASTVIATHLNQFLLAHALQLPGHEETQPLLDRLATTAPRLTQDLAPKTLPPRVVARVPQNLLAEQAPIRNPRTTAETLAEHGSRSQDTDASTAAVRVALGRMIVRQINILEEELTVITLAAELEQILLFTQRTGRDKQAPLEPGIAERLHKALQDTARKQKLVGQSAVVAITTAVTSAMKIERLCASNIRETLPKVRDELGADAVIPSNQRTTSDCEIFALVDRDEQPLDGVQQRAVAIEAAARQRTPASEPASESREAAPTDGEAMLAATPETPAALEPVTPAESARDAKPRVGRLTTHAAY